MDWHFDTSTVGECAAKDLRGVLEKARDHFFNSQAAHVEFQIRQAAGAPPVAPPGAPAITPEQHDAWRERAADYAAKGKAAREKHVADAAHPTLAAQVALAIDQACAQADAFGGTVTASVRGHYDPRHVSGVHQRIQVSVDQVLP